MIFTLLDERIGDLALIESLSDDSARSVLVHGDSGLPNTSHHARKSDEDSECQFAEVKIA